MTKLMVLAVAGVIIYALFIVDDLGKYHMDKKYGDKEK